MRCRFCERILASGGYRRKTSRLKTLGCTNVVQTKCALFKPLKLLSQNLVDLVGIVRVPVERATPGQLCRSRLSGNRTSLVLLGGIVIQVLPKPSFYLRYGHSLALAVVSNLISVDLLEAEIPRFGMGEVEAADA